MLHRLGQGERVQEVAEVIGERVQLVANSIVAEALAREPAPVDGVLAFVDPLLRR